MRHRVKDFVEVSGECNADQLPVLEEDSNWQEISVPETLEIPAAKPDISNLLEVIIGAEVISYRIINTPRAATQQGIALDAVNFEGEISTGKKLIVEGVIKQKVIYVGKRRSQSLHAAHFAYPFSTYIIIPAVTPLDAEFQIDVFVEDLYIQSFSPRKIFKNVTLFLNARRVD